MAMFVFTIMGNVTYSWSILAKSLEREYLIQNSSWLAGQIIVDKRVVVVDISLIGSALTIFLDIFVSLVSYFIWYG